MSASTGTTNDSMADVTDVAAAADAADAADVAVIHTESNARVGDGVTLLRVINLHTVHREGVSQRLHLLIYLVMAISAHNDNAPLSGREPGLKICRSPGARVIACLLEDDAANSKAGKRTGSL